MMFNFWFFMYQLPCKMGPKVFDMTPERYLDYCYEQMSKYDKEKETQ